MKSTVHMTAVTESNVRLQWSSMSNSYSGYILVSSMFNIQNKTSRRLDTDGDLPTHTAWSNVRPFDIREAMKDTRLPAELFTSIVHTTG